METKQCRVCKKLKPLADFYKDTRYFMGVRSECKPCGAINEKNRYQKKSLASKPQCARADCTNFLALHKIKYCSNQCSDKIFAKKTWEAQKKNPNYKEYHRKIAREWARKRRLELKQSKDL